jgi:hypothetical protein
MVARSNCLSSSKSFAGSSAAIRSCTGGIASGPIAVKARRMASNSFWALR